MRLMNLGLTAPGFEMAATDVTDVPDTAGDTFLRDTLRAAESPRRPAERRVGGVVPVRRSQLWAATRLADPRDEITQESPFDAEVVAAPVVAAVPTAPIIRTTDLQLDVRAAIIRKFGKTILNYFDRATGLYAQPIKQEPRSGRLKVDFRTGQLVTSTNPATGVTLDFKVFINPFSNRVNLDPAEKAAFEAFAASDSYAPLYRAILALDGMAILGHPADAVDSALPDANPEKLTGVNKATLKIMVPNVSAITVDWSDVSMATGISIAKIVRLYFALDGSICRADARTASLEFSTPYSEGFNGSPHYVDVAMTDNTLLAHGELSHLTPRQITAFLALYQDPEMANQREVVEKEFPGLGQRVMANGFH